MTQQGDAAGGGFASFDDTTNEQTADAGERGDGDTVWRWPVVPCVPQINATEGVFANPTHPLRRSNPRECRLRIKVKVASREYVLRTDLYPVDAEIEDIANTFGGLLAREQYVIEIGRRSPSAAGGFGRAWTSKHWSHEDLPASRYPVQPWTVDPGETGTIPADVTRHLERRRALTGALVSPEGHPLQAGAGEFQGFTAFDPATGFVDPATFDSTAPYGAPQPPPPPPPPPGPPAAPDVFEGRQRVPGYVLVNNQWVAEAVYLAGLQRVPGYVLVRGQWLPDPLLAPPPPPPPPAFAAPGVPAAPVESPTIAMMRIQLESDRLRMDKEANDRRAETDRREKAEKEDRDRKERIEKEERDRRDRLDREERERREKIEKAEQESRDKRDREDRERRDRDDRERQEAAKVARENQEKYFQLLVGEVKEKAKPAEPPGLKAMQDTLLGLKADIAAAKAGGPMESLKNRIKEAVDIGKTVGMALPGDGDGGANIEAWERQVDKAIPMAEKVMGMVEMWVGKHLRESDAKASEAEAKNKAAELELQGTKRLVDQQRQQLEAVEAEKARLALEVARLAQIAAQPPQPPAFQQGGAVPTFPEWPLVPAMPAADAGVPLPQVTYPAGAAVPAMGAPAPAPPFPTPPAPPAPPRLVSIDELMKM